MKRFASATICLGLITSVASAQAPESNKYAVCNAIQVTSTTTKVKVPQRATAYCETGNEGGGVQKHCDVTLAPTAADFILDPEVEQYTCAGITGQNACAFIRPGPLVFLSDRSATRSFFTDSERAGLTQIVGQARQEKTYQQTILMPQNFTISAGRQFVIKRLRSADSVRLECTTTAQESIVAAISRPGQNIADRIKFIRIENAEPYDLFVYDVAPR